MTRRGLRIVGGALGGRRLEVPRGIRPSAERVREALLAVWQERLEGCCFLELFCGSGAVGFEAGSRGAKLVLFVDNDSQVLRTVQRNSRALGAGPWKIQRLHLPEGLGALRGEWHGRIDLAFADPPYGFDRFGPLLEQVAPLLSPTGELAIEHSSHGADLPSAPSGLLLRDRKRYGDTLLSFFHRPQGKART